MAKIPDDEVEIFDTIPQSVLKEYLRLQNRQEFLKECIRKSLDAGKPVEGGIIDAKLVTSMRGTPPWKAELEKIIGADKVKTIADAWPKSESISLKVTVKTNAVISRGDFD